MRGLPLTVVAGALWASQVQPCDFARPAGPLEDQVRAAVTNAATVFVGRVTQVTPRTMRRLVLTDDSIESISVGYVVQFEVRAIWKGPASPLLTVTTGSGGGDCGYAFKLGEAYLVYAGSAPPQRGFAAGDDVRERVLPPPPLFSTDITYRTAPAAHAETDLSILGTPSWTAEAEAEAVRRARLYTDSDTPGSSGPSAQELLEKLRERKGDHSAVCKTTASVDCTKLPQDLLVHGMTLVEVLVGPDGRAAFSRIVRSGDPRVEALAVEAARRHTFEPATRGGQPTTESTVVEVSFDCPKHHPYLVGDVTDQDGVPLAGASVKVQSGSLIGGSRTTTTDARGRFRFPALPDGEFTITAELWTYFPEQCSATLARSSAEVSLRLRKNPDERPIEIRPHEDIVQ